MRRRIAALAATTVIAAGGFAATATSASATIPIPPGGGSWDHTWVTKDANHGGTVYVKEHGDIVMLCDTAADNKSPHVALFREVINGPSVPIYDLTASGGNGTCVSASAAQGGKYDLPENQYIDVVLGVGPYYDGEVDTYFLNDH